MSNDGADALRAAVTAARRLQLSTVKDVRRVLKDNGYNAAAIEEAMMKWAVISAPAA